MKRLKLLVAFLTLFIDLIPAVAMAPEVLPNPSPTPGEQRQPVQNSGANKDQEAHEPKTLAQASPPANVQQSAPISNPNVQQPSNQPSQPSSNSGGWDWMTIFTFALVAVGAFQAYTYHRQAGYMRDGLELTRDSNKAAQVAAEAAKSSADTAERALKLTERAYVIITDWRWGDPMKETANRVYCYFVNNGRTEARVIGYWTYQIVDKKPADIPTDYHEHLMTGGWEMVIPAEGRQKISINWGDKLEIPATIKQVGHGGMPFYAFAYVLYEDVFGEQYEVGSLVRYQEHGNQFPVQPNSTYNFNRKKRN